MQSRRLTGNRRQRANWRQISAVLASNAFLSSVEVDMTAGLRIESVPWEQYWCRSAPGWPQHLGGKLEALRWAREGYTRSGFAHHFALPYCYAYFSLLRETVESVRRGQADPRLLRAVLGFECTGISWQGPAAPLGVLTSTVKNPVYLLAKLRQPKAYEDPKFLPLTTVCGPSDDQVDQTPLFYYYRQLTPGVLDGFRLLVCPPVERAVRRDAFMCLQSLGAALGPSRDTRVRQRSVRIAELAVGPFLERLRASSAGSGDSEVRIADLGAGSGDLTRAVLERVTSRSPNLLEGCRLSWTLVDLAFPDIRRHAFRRGFSHRLSELRCERTDYASWIQRQAAGGAEKRFDIVLLCRLLNNASRFSIGWVDDWHQVRKLGRRAMDRHAWKEGAYLPHIALRCAGLRAPGLLASNGRVPLLNGSTFCQLSLSDYFRGLQMLTEGPPATNVGPDAVFFPVRRFDESALELPNGGSLLESLCSFSTIVIIEDVDLDARVLRRHLAQRQLGDLAASDATNRSRMRVANLLCVAARHHAAILPGRRLW